MVGNIWSLPTCIQRCVLCGKLWAIHGHWPHVFKDVLCVQNAFCHSNINEFISKMKEIFAEHGVPYILRSDNGPQYPSAAFTDFTEESGFQHSTSSSHYPVSNGFAESTVKIIKTAFTKTNYSGEDPQHTLLALCSTPVDYHLPTPVQLLHQWKLKPDCLHSHPILILMQMNTISILRIMQIMPR